jgi:two-component system NtrC family sensor kinase
VGSEAKSPVPLRHRLTVRLTGGVLVTLLLIGVPFLFAFHKLQRQRELQRLAEATEGLSRILVDGLRSTMLAGRPHALDQTIRNLGREQEIDRVMLLDHAGRVRVASDPDEEGRVVDRDREATCRVCHQAGGASPGSPTVVTWDEGRRVFRAMSVVRNGPECHGCHPPASRVNGILVTDLALASADRRFLADIGGTAALGTVMLVLTVGVLVLLLDRTVHRPLREVVSTSQRIVGGDLDARVEAEGAGEFALLASQLNRMTDHLARSLRTVEAQRRELQAILDATDDEIVVLDRERRVVAANRAYRDRSGRREVEVVGHLCRELPPAHGPCLENEPGGCPVGKVFETGQHHWGVTTHVGPDGKERAIEIHGSPLRDRDGVVTHAVEVRRDISERRQMEATLAHSERLVSLGLLASGLSHEINNPLGAIGASVDGLRRRLASEPGQPPPAPEELERVLARIGGEVERGRQITHRLLKVARPSTGAVTLVDTNRVIEDVLLILAHQTRQAGVSTRLGLASPLPPLWADEPRLGQVLMNLVLNALQAMDGEGGELQIATASEGGGARIEVADTGCGIAPEHLRRIYEPFFTTKPPGKGTGLGLFITHQIVTGMGGTIEARSEPGRGTTMTVRLPRGRRGSGP